MWDTVHWMMTLSDSTSLNVMSSGLTGSTGSRWMEGNFKRNSKTLEFADL